MARILQLIKNPRQDKDNKSRTPKLRGNPQKKAICQRVFTISPKKPNPANRPVVRVKMVQTKQVLIAKIVGEKNSLQQYSTVLLSGRRSRDLIGVNYAAIRGKYDFSGVTGRKTSRSIYGVRRPK
jgi:small subunit ribosomal protein S12